MDWATVAGAIAGGAIGLLGDLTGRLGARRQAAQQRREMLEDLARVRDERIEDEQRQAIYQRACQAAEDIVQTIRNNPVVVHSARPEVDMRERIRAVHLALYSESLYIPDPHLRELLQRAEYMLDISLTQEEGHDVPLPDVIHIVRNNVYRWLGAWLRGEPIPPPSTAWTELVPKMDRAMTEWQAWVRSSGREIDVNYL